MRNPVSATKAPPDPDHEVQPAPVEAVLGMMRLAADEEDWVYSALHMLVYTGVRRGELLALCWDHVELDSGEVRIAYSLGRRSKGLIRKKPKTARSIRTINLDARTVDVMRQHEARQARELSRKSMLYSARRVGSGESLPRHQIPN